MARFHIPDLGSSIRFCTFILLGAACLLALTMGQEGPRSESAGTENQISATVGSPAALSPDVPAAWRESALAELERREYGVSPVEGDLQAPNRRQGYRTYFRPDGIQIEPRIGAGGWSWTWTTLGHGRDELVKAEAVPPRSHITRVDYERGGFREWYENREEGLEQLFSLERSPAGEGPLRVVGLIGGGLEARLVDGGLEYVTAGGGRVLRYDKLVAWDADGKDLPGEISIQGDELTLLIDDRHARYPVTIDPLISSAPWTIEGDQFRGYLGEVIAPAGDVNGDGFGDIIVGSPDYTTNGYTYYGHAFLYYGGAGGPAATPAWEFSGDENNGDFGISVACAGDVNGDGFDDIIIGEPDWDDGGIFDGGRVWFWYGSAGGLDPDNADEYFREDLGSDFGECVGSAGDLNGDGYDDVFICNWGIDRIEVAYGSADGIGPYVTDWGYSPGFTSSRFAYSACGAGDINGDGYDDLVVGNPYHDPGQYGVYIFHGGPGGLGSLPSGYAEPADTSALSGWSVTAAGDIDGDGYADVQVGCPNDYAGQGKLCIHRGSAAGLESDATWVLEEDSDMASLGRRAICGGDVNGDGFADVLARMSIDDGAGNFTTRVSLYLGGFAGLAADPSWTINSATGESFHGVNSVGDINGDGFCDIAIGDTSHNVDRGRIDVYAGGAVGPKNDPGWVVESNQAGARFGYSVASAGDVNGDGFDDVLVGAPFYDNGQSNEGAVFLYFGSNQGLGWLPLWWAEGNQANAYLGESVASAGDVNGDGLCDVIAGAAGYLVGGDDVGAAFVWESAEGGIPYGNPSNADWSFIGDQDHSLLGCAVDGAGDVNGDGYSDVIVGAYLYDHGTENEGGVWVFHGSESGLATTHSWFHDTNHGGSGYGFSVAGAGDVDGDGYDDVLVGAPHYNHPSADEGLVFLYRGSADGVLPGAPWWYAQSDQAGAMLGYSVAGANDINGDGFADIICGMPFWDGIADDVGGVLVWHGGPTPPPVGNPDNADRGIFWLVGDALFGHSVDGAGDLDNDGFGDIVAGCPWNTGAEVQNGFAIVYLGSGDGLEGTFDWLIEGNQAYGHFGSNVAAGGDVNGDGFCDLLVSSDNYSAGQINEGRAHLFFGNDSRGLPRSPRQWQDDFSQHIGPLGRSNSGTSFGLTARGRTAAGRDKVRLEYEVKPMGTAFDGSGIVLGSGWTDTGIPLENGGSTVDLSAVVDGLSQDTGYRWRLRIGASNPYFPRTPWLHHSGNGATLLDLSTDGGMSAVADEGRPPAPTAQLGNYPNPFNPRTVVRYLVPAAGHVRLRIYDARGHLVRTLVNADLPAGEREAEWCGEDDNGRHLAAGLYLARLETPSGTATHKLSLIK
jgi:hypothetical protein